MFAVQKFVLKLRNWLLQPQKVLATCMILFFMSLFLNGTIWKIWGLTQDKKNIANQILQVQAGILNFDKQMKQAKDPQFIEHQARDKMDMVGENDLIFVFSE